MTNYTPATEQVENGFAHDSEDEYHDPVNYPSNERMRRRDFQRWLAQVRVEAQVKALRKFRRELIEHQFEFYGVILLHIDEVVDQLAESADRIAREAGIETEEAGA